jgi:3-hydroxyanthranilate 3,4-dioxygenase
MMLPFNLQQWIEENREFLKPPINNKNLYKQAGDFIVMVVGGPNARKDYHYNESEELFCSYTDPKNPSWKEIPGLLKHVSINNNKLYGVNSSNYVY